MALGYYLILPVMLKFLFTFGSNIVTSQIRLDDYLNLIFMLEAGLGFACETPVIMYVLAKTGLVGYRGFRKVWRWVIILAFIVGAIFNPTLNPMNQIVIAGIIVTLYWVGILLAWIVERGRKKKEAMST